MCECLECITLNVINTLLSLIIIVMNGIYAIWGIILPHSDAREVWKEYIDKLELYVNVVSYSDAVVLPLKIICMLVVKWLCCSCQKHFAPPDDGDPCPNCNRDVFSCGDQPSGPKITRHKSMGVFTVA